MRSAHLVALLAALITCDLAVRVLDRARERALSAIERRIG